MSKQNKKQLGRHKSELDLLVQDKKILCIMLLLKMRLFKQIIEAKDYVFVDNYFSENKDFEILKQDIHNCLNLIDFNYFPEFKKKASLEKIYRILTDIQIEHRTPKFKIVNH